MAAPIYGHDLTDWIIDSDTTAWGELVSAIAGGPPDEADTESALQATNSCSQSTNATSLCSMCRILTSPITISSGNVLLVWHGHGVATALLGYSSGGLRLAVADTLTDWKAWAVGGNDVSPFPYSKWVNNPIDPSIAYEYSNGTPPAGTSYYGVGSMCQLSAAVAKGQPHIVDMMRYGRAEARFSNGESGNPATFAGFAAVNDASSARWGLIQAVAGGYQWKGLMTLGYSSTAVYMTVSNTTIFIQDCRKVTSGFNKIEVRVATSVINWTNITFNNVAPSTNASKGDFEMINAADVNISGCSFIDMGTFIFQSSGAALNSLFLRCAAITSGGGVFTGTKVLLSAVAADAFAFGWNVATNPDGYLDNMTFSKGTNAHHAIGFGTTCLTSMTLRTVTFSGFNAVNGSNDSALYFADKGSDTTWTISLVGCTGTITYKKARSGDTVNFVIDPATFSVTVKDIDTGAVIVGARVLVLVTSGVNFPYQASVTITSSGTIATVAHTAHGLASNDNVLISGAVPDTYNGAFTITVTGVDQYQYTLPASATSPATGTITATMALINKDTNGSGVASDSRTYPSANQPVTGWVRLATGSYYKQQPISETINKTSGLAVTVQLIPDA